MKKLSKNFHFQISIHLKKSLADGYKNQIGNHQIRIDRLKASSECEILQTQSNSEGSYFKIQYKHENVMHTDIYRRRELEGQSLSKATHLQKQKRDNEKRKLLADAKQITEQFNKNQFLGQKRNNQINFPFAGNTFSSKRTPRITYCDTIDLSKDMNVSNLEFNKDMNMEEGDLADQISGFVPIKEEFIKKEVETNESRIAPGRLECDRISEIMKIDLSRKRSKIKWAPRFDGTVPPISWKENEEIKKYDKEKLLDALAKLSEHMK